MRLFKMAVSSLQIHKLFRTIIGNDICLLFLEILVIVTQMIVVLFLRSPSKYSVEFTPCFDVKLGTILQSWKAEI